ncbi:MAG TPA: hypothetical protein VG944_03675 [Fimbriimonas sp.]|nr:hypothetical protein [Fimbriimonas sp.]
MNRLVVAFLACLIGVACPVAYGKTPLETSWQVEREIHRGLAVSRSSARYTNTNGNAQLLNGAAFQVSCLRRGAPAQGGSHDDAPIYRFEFPVTDGINPATLHGGYIRGGIGFGEWCVLSFVDYPAFSISGRFGTVSSIDAESKVNSLKKIVDTPDVRRLFERAGTARPKLLRSFSVAIAQAYLLDEGLVSPKTSSLSVRQTILALERFLRPSASARQDVLRECVASIALAKLLTKQDEKLRVLKNVLALSDKKCDYMGLCATVFECRIAASQGKFAKVRNIASSGLKRYARLRKWQDYWILTLVKANPVHGLDGVQPLQ